MPAPKITNVMLILLGDGATTEVFTSPCALASKSIKFSSNVQEDAVFDCPGADPATYAPTAAWVQTVKTALSAAVSGSGKLAAENLATWWAWYQANNKNIRVYIRSKDGTVKGYFGMSALLTDFEVGQETEKGLVDCSVSIKADGAVTWTAVA